MTSIFSGLNVVPIHQVSVKFDKIGKNVQIRRSQQCGDADFRTHPRFLYGEHVCQVGVRWRVIALARNVSGGGGGGAEGGGTKSIISPDTPVAGI